MAHIVDIRVHALKGSVRTQRRRAPGTAEIVMFPGVRYERLDDATTARQKAVGRMRDLIDLPD